MQAIASGATCNFLGRKKGALQKDMPRRVTHTAVLATHDARECQGALVVGNHQTACRERYFRPVEQGHCFIRVRIPNPDAAM